MHGLGNDFVVFDGPLVLGSDAIQAVCNRRTGIGADGILIVTPTGDNVVQMGYWNADGSRSRDVRQRPALRHPLRHRPGLAVVRRGSGRHRRRTAHRLGRRVTVVFGSRSDSRSSATNSAMI